MKSILQTINESIRSIELDDIVLNEAFQSKAIQQIYSKGGLGKELLAGYDRYGIALNEIKDGEQIVETRGPEKADGEHFYDYQKFLNSQAQRLASSMEKSKSGPEVMRKSYIYSYDLLVVSNRGLEARFRKETHHGKDVWTLYEKNENFLSRGRRKPGFEDLYNFLDENKGAKVYLILISPKTKTETRAEKDTKNVKEQTGQSKEAVAKAKLNNAIKLGSDLIEKFFNPIKEIADIKVYSGVFVNFNKKGKKDKEICVLDFELPHYFSGRPTKRKDIFIGYKGSSTNFAKKIQIDGDQQLGEIVSFIDQNMDKFLELINKNKAYEKQCYDELMNIK